jgi:hypothetical protein
VTQIAFWLAVACGVISASTGNRTACALLASVGLCMAFTYLHVPFHFILWLLIDLAVIRVIIRPTMTAADCVILALFFPAWVSYLLPDAERFRISFIVVVAQLLLTFPAEMLRRAITGLLKPHDKGPPDMMVVHA